MNTKNLIDLLERKLLGKDLGKVDIDLDDIPEVKAAYFQGFVSGYGLAAYIAGLLDGKKIAIYWNQIEPGLMQRLMHKLPDNSLEHIEELERLLREESRNYIESWERYNQLFRNAA